MYDEVPDWVKCDFTFLCQGNGMINARIYDGDIVYIRKTRTVEDGQIAAVAVGEEILLKRVRFFPDHIVLESENPKIRPLSFWDENMADVQIIGAAVAFTGCIR